MATKQLNKKAVDVSHGLAYVTHMYTHATRKSWTVLNDCLRSAVGDAIRCGMRFEIGDIEKFPETGYWFNGEMHYSKACGGSDNMSFCLAYESHTGRKPWLWAEASKTPARLAVGSKFSWCGKLVTITSFNDENDSLIACSYKQGQVKIEKRFTITHDELTEVRKAADARIKQALATLDAAATLDELEGASQTLAQSHRESPFRHFDIERLRELVSEIQKTRFRDESDRRDSLFERTRESQALEKWRNGENVSHYFQDIVALRVKDGFVETTTGQRATVDSVKRAMTIWRKRKGRNWESINKSCDEEPEMKIDNHRIVSMEAAGCQIGCTFVTAAEIEALAALLA